MRSEEEIRKAMKGLRPVARHNVTHYRRTLEICPKCIKEALKWVLGE